MITYLYALQLQLHSSARTIYAVCCPPVYVCMYVFVCIYLSTMYIIHIYIK